LTGLQSLSGTGALRVAMEFIKRYGKSETIYYGEPTWPNHNNIIRDASLKQATYYWYDPSTKLANFKKAFEDIKKLPEGAFVLLHACAHNPTGVILFCI
jgi:aspartate/tyrosine/aromatic aminotransferase